MPVSKPSSAPKESSEHITRVKKTHTVKTQLVVDEQTHEILKIDSTKGRVHDFTLFKRSRICLHPDTEILADLGYLGMKKIHKNSCIPYVGYKKRPLTKEKKRFNYQLSRRRIRIENIIRECKIFRIAKHIYRGKHKNYGLVWNVVARLVNFKNQHLFRKDVY
jgi:hypothetical protein